MGVIGIVSALTLPNLNSSTGDKERVAKVKKIYQSLSDALGRAEAVYGPFGEWFVNDGDDNNAKTKRAGERITEFMKTSKVCAQAEGGGCFAPGSMKLLNGSDFVRLDYGASRYKFITADGMSIAFTVSSYTQGGVPGLLFNIYVDIDGPTKGPYTANKDIFRFISYDRDGYTLNLGDETIEELISNRFNSVGGLSTWIIRYDNADYLKLDSDGKCPNGTTPTEANPRCK